MIVTSISLIPALVCLIWGFIFLFQMDKSSSQKVLTALTLLGCLYFYSDACYIIFDGTHQEYITLVYADIISQFVTMAIPPLFFMFFGHLKGREILKPGIYLTFMPAVIFGLAGVLIYTTIGIDAAATYIAAYDTYGAIPPEYTDRIYQAHYYICHVSYIICITAELLCLVIYIVMTLSHSNFKLRVLVDFFRGRTAVKSIYPTCFMILIFIAVCMIRMGLGRLYLIDHPVLSSLFYLLIGATLFAIAYIGEWFCDRDFSFWDVTHPSILPPQLKRDAKIEDAVFSGDEAAEEAESTLASYAEGHAPNLSLLSKFVSYMSLEQPYLNPELTIAEVAHYLHTNRTYISTMVNQNFKMSFRDYVNLQRINTAKRLMLADPNEILENIAANSGFVSDSQLVKKFKEVEGVSPRSWQALQR